MGTAAMMIRKVLPPADVSADEMKTLGVFFPKWRYANLHNYEEDGGNPSNENTGEKGDHGFCSRIVPCLDV